ncbi:MAG: membrane protein insertase YidC [Holosporales bacterium]|jgi:YidC/Oxa1 family membrane protein insertase|nr:membrane protein insertase YidC [Holosporales bacterium]
MNEHKNILMAIGLSFLVFLGWRVFFVPSPESLPYPSERVSSQEQGKQKPAPKTHVKALPPLAPVKNLPSAPRVAIEAPQLKGSFSLRGERFDDVSLKNFRKSVEEKSASIHLLSAQAQEPSSFIRFGWHTEAYAGSWPDEETVWTASSSSLTPESPMTLTWKNAQGVAFERIISIDRNFLITVRQRIHNHSEEVLMVQPFACVEGQPSEEVKGQWVVHEGAVGFVNGRIEERNFEDLQKEGTVTFSGSGGWAGLTEKYWLVAFLTDATAKQQTTYHYLADRQRYIVETQGEKATVPIGGTAEVVYHFYIGAKDLQLLDGYEEQLGVKHFDLAIDFGCFYFLTRPLFYGLVYMKDMLEGHIGWCIIILTVLIKLLLFPLANKSYKAMSRMKKLQPKVQEIQQRYKEDKEKMSQELMALYKREHVNPVGGCLPQLFQFPVLFALYKVFLVSIDMRHASMWWINDLSAPDPMWITNAFGLFPWTPVEFLQIGIWPLLMGLTGLLQQKMSPPPGDPAQAKMLLMMPLMFTFMLAQLPAGLVMYWTWSNILSMLQQRLVMRVEERRQEKEGA